MIMFAFILPLLHTLNMKRYKNKFFIIVYHIANDLWNISVDFSEFLVSKVCRNDIG